jgi:hypothetical protein
MRSRLSAVRVFISSTFLDMHAERDHLVTVVFPELRERLALLGLDFFDVDLRWGVPNTTPEGERANSWAYCKQWIDRVEPFFLCILGERYGWIPPQEEIPFAEDRSIFATQSVTEMEIRHAVLTGRRKRRSYFYFRATKVTPPPETDPSIYRQYVDDGPAQLRLERLRKDIVQSGNPTRDYVPRWTGQAFVDLDAFGAAVLEDLWSGVLRDPRYLDPATWRRVLQADPQNDPRYTGSAPLLPELWTAIVELARPTEQTPLEAESQQMVEFAESRLRWFHGRLNELNQLHRFLGSAETESPVAVVVAPPGQGKSSLLARLISELDVESHLVIAHFVGATERSSEVRLLLERLLGELERQGIAAPEPGQRAAYDVPALAARLLAILKAYRGPRRLVLLLDGVNQLVDGHDLRWLPVSAGSNARIIVSTIDESHAPSDIASRDTLQALLQRKEIEWISVSPLGPREIRSIVVEYLHEYCKELDEESIDAICSTPQATNPLYLLVLLDELRTLAGADLQKFVPRLIRSAQRTYPDAAALFDAKLARLEVFGAEATRLWLTYLYLGRAGMLRSELRALVSRRLGGEAAVAVARIERGIRRYLQQRGERIDFFHSQLRQAVEQRYLPSEASQREGHKAIAEFFESSEARRERTLSELIHHLNAACWDEQLITVMASELFPKEKLVRQGYAEVAGDYLLAIDACERLNRWVEGVRFCNERLLLSLRVEAYCKPEVARFAGRIAPRNDLSEVRAIASFIRAFSVSPVRESLALSALATHLPHGPDRRQLLKRAFDNLPGSARDLHGESLSYYYSAAREFVEAIVVGEVTGGTVHEDLPRQTFAFHATRALSLRAWLAGDRNPALIELADSAAPAEIKHSTVDCAAQVLRSLGHLSAAKALIAPLARPQFSSWSPIAFFAAIRAGQKHWVRQALHYDLGQGRRWDYEACLFYLSTADSVPRDWARHSVHQVNNARARSLLNSLIRRVVQAYMLFSGDRPNSDSPVSVDAERRMLTGWVSWLARLSPSDVPPDLFLELGSVCAALADHVRAPSDAHQDALTSLDSLIERIGTDAPPNERAEAIDWVIRVALEAGRNDIAQRALAARVELAVHHSRQDLRQEGFSWVACLPAFILLLWLALGSAVLGWQVLLQSNEPFYKFVGYAMLAIGLLPWATLVLAALAIVVARLKLVVHEAADYWRVRVSDAGDNTDLLVSIANLLVRTPADSSSPLQIHLRLRALGRQVRHADAAGRLSDRDVRQHLTEVIDWCRERWTACVQGEVREFSPDNFIREILLSSDLELRAAAAEFVLVSFEENRRAPVNGAGWIGAALIALAVSDPATALNAFESVNTADPFEGPLEQITHAIKLARTHAQVRRFAFFMLRTIATRTRGNHYHALVHTVKGVARTSAWGPHEQRTAIKTVGMPWFKQRPWLYAGYLLLLGPPMLLVAILATLFTFAAVLIYVLTVVLPFRHWRLPSLEEVGRV